MGVVAAGRMSKRVQLQRRASGQDSVGQQNGAWTTFATVWADIRVMSGLGEVNAELSAADHEVARARVSVRIRHRADVDHGCRVVHNDDVYDVRVPLFDPHGEFVDLVCALGAREG